jgi:diguanylate cyclase (GGDEF)-like protein
MASREMRGAGIITFVAGGLLVAVAWVAGAIDATDPYRSLAEVLAEPLGVLILVLAWRFRRSRVALSAMAIAMTNILVRGPLEAEMAGAAAAGLVALALLVPLNLGVIVLLRDHPLPQVGSLIHVLLLIMQPWLWAGILHIAGRQPVGIETTAGWRQILMAPHAALLAFLIAAVFTALAFAMRRSTFEIAMLWVLVAVALALFGQRGAHEATLMLAASQLVLLFALVEDSYRLAYHDELTGLPGRRALDEALRLLDGDYTIAMVDIDHFKRFNDRYGHEVGDQALRMVADELSRVGGGGRSYRYGGEEFAVVFPGTVPRDSWEPLENLRTALADRSFAIRSPKRPRKKPDKPVKNSTSTEKVALTVSIGGAGPAPQQTSPDAVLRTADEALYKAKRRGRNRVVVEGARTKPVAKKKRS